jgi:hypothetical protein
MRGPILMLVFLLGLPAALGAQTQGARGPT